jgi:hypothetical protein
LRARDAPRRAEQPARCSVCRHRPGATLGRRRVRRPPTRPDRCHPQTRRSADTTSFVRLHAGPWLHSADQAYARYGPAVVLRLCRNSTVSPSRLSPSGGTPSAPHYWPRATAGSLSPPSLRLHRPCRRMPAGADDPSPAQGQVSTELCRAKLVRAPLVSRHRANVRAAATTLANRARSSQAHRRPILNTPINGQARKSVCGFVRTERRSYDLEV